MPRKKAVIAVMAAGLIACYFFIVSGVDSGDLHRSLVQWRELAPLFFVAMHVIRPFTFLPSSILILLAALYFQFWSGFLLNLFGITLSMTAAYAAGRILGHQWLVSRYPASEAVIARLNSASWASLAAVRLIPLFPADLISYTSGVCQLAYPSYILGSILGSIPGLVVIMSLGAGIREGEMLWLASALPVLLVLAVWIWKKAKIVWGL